MAKFRILISRDDDQMLGIKTLADAIERDIKDMVPCEVFIYSNSMEIEFEWEVKDEA